MLKRRSSLFVIILVICLILVSGCGKKEPDAIKIKKEYEKYNISMEDDNPFMYISEKELDNKIGNKEAFCLFICTPKNENCRRDIAPLIEASKDLNIKTIYYMDSTSLSEDFSLKAIYDFEKPYIMAFDGTIQYASDGIPTSDTEEEKNNELLEEFKTVLTHGISK